MKTSPASPTDFYLRALPHWHSYQKDRIAQAIDLLGKAIERDPDYGSALALAANCHHLLEVNGWVNDLETNSRIGISLARRSLQAAPKSTVTSTTEHSRSTFNS